MARVDFDVVIVGSGFGGAVMAYRHAQAKKRVLVLERGKSYPPGSFARSPVAMSRNFWDPSAGLQGVFNLWSFRSMDAVVAAGLGGGSLLYANVLLRKDEKWFVKEDLARGGFEYWPVTRKDLDPHYDEVEKMLGGRPYPFDKPPYDATPKTIALRDAARHLGLAWSLPKLAVAFGDEASPVPGEPIHEDEPNLHGRTRLSCRLCGECNIGCNYGSKNSLDFTYLSAAKRLSAQIETRCEVRTFSPRPEGGFTISYVEHTEANEGTPTRTEDLPLKTITASKLVLAAGTFGTTFLLLRNAKSFPRLSPALGQRFSGNGDVLTFAMRSRKLAKGRSSTLDLDATRGPVITSSVRVPDTLDGGTGPGFYLQDAGFPAIAAWSAQIADAPSSVFRGLRFLVRYLRGAFGFDPDTDLASELSELIGSCDLSGASLPLLGMGHDVPDGVMHLRDGRLELDWSQARSRAYYDRIEGTAAALAQRIGGSFFANPTQFLDRQATVHALGGCPIGDDPGASVADAWGQVHGYPGLYIADGSAVPGPVGANPALTIAALADRFALRMLDQ